MSGSELDRRIATAAPRPDRPKSGDASRHTTTLSKLQNEGRFQQAMPADSNAASRKSSVDWSALKNIGSYLWSASDMPMRARVLLALTLLGLSKVAMVCVPIFLSRLVDTYSNPQSLGATLPLVALAGYATVFIAASAFSELRDLVFAKVAQRSIRMTALKTFEHLHGLSLGFHLQRQTGSVSRALSRGMMSIQVLLNFLLFNILPTLVELALICGILWSFFDLRFSLATLISVVMYVGLTLVLTERGLRHTRGWVMMNQQAFAQAVDSLLNYETVKYFGNERHEAERFDASLREQERSAVANQRVVTLLRLGQVVIAGASLAVLLTMAALSVRNGTMTVGGLVLVNSYMIQLFLPLGFLGQMYRAIKEGVISIEAMGELLATKPEIDDSAEATPLDPGPGTIEVDRVSFSFGPERAILEDLTFTVPAGKSAAIVGASGAGKSTIVRLLFRLYDVSSGVIRIDGRDIRDVTQATLRAAIGIVPQDTVLFNDTIYYNIAYGRPGATPAEVEEAARHAQIHDFIMQAPDGYQTKVGERGLKLSGGEKQRMAIARTILKRPRILLFDEATSALDSETEQNVQEALRKVSRDRTTLIVAHRLSTITHVDEIIVLEGGRIAERGTHESLLQRRGLYAAMWNRQQVPALGDACA